MGQSCRLGIVGIVSSIAILVCFTVTQICLVANDSWKMKHFSYGTVKIHPYDDRKVVEYPGRASAIRDLYRAALR